MLAATSQDVNEELKKLAVQDPNSSTSISPEELVEIMQQGIAEKNTKFLIGLLWTKERLIGHQSLRTLSLLPEQYRYQFLALMVEEDSFWRNLNFETDQASEIQGIQQECVVAGVAHMIQQDVSLQDFYDPEKRGQIQKIVAYVLKNDLPDRKPDWKPRERIEDARPKKTILLEDLIESPTMVQTRSTPAPLVTTPSQIQTPSPSPTIAKPQPPSVPPIATLAIASAVVLGIIFFIFRRKSK